MADAKTADKLAVLLAEYETLRNESLDAIRHRLTIVGFAFAGLAVLVHSAASDKLSLWASTVLLVGVIPLMSGAVLLMWLGEYRRMMRAGGGVARVEQEINKMLGEDVMVWEQALSKGHQHMTYPYAATVFLLGATTFFSICVGVAQFVRRSAIDLKATWDVISLGVGLVVLAGAVFAYFWKVRGYWRAATELREHASTSGAKRREGRTA